MNLYRVAEYGLAAILLLVVPPARAAGAAWQKMIVEGDKDLSLQKLAPAQEMFETALKQVEHSSHSPDDIVLCLERLASVNALENKADEAIPLYRRSLGLLEQTYGKSSPKIVPTLVALGSIYESEGDHELAMRLYSRALTINEKNYGVLSPAVAGSLQNLGRASFKAGKTEDAERNYKQSLAILMKNPNLSASKQLESLLGDYSDLLRRKDGSENDLIREFHTTFPLPDREPVKIVSKSPMEASVPPSVWQQQLLHQSTIIGERQNNEERNVMSRAFNEPLKNNTLAPAYNTISDVYHRQHSYKDEEARYQRMVAIDIKSLGADHPTVADDLYGLVLLYVSEGRYAEAKPLLVRALNIYQSVYGSDSLLVQNAQATLASVVNKLDNPLQAAALYNSDASGGAFAIQPNSLDTAKRLNELGYIYYRQGRLDDASTIYKWALSSTEAATGKDSPLVAACLNDYAHVLTSLGRNVEAEQMEMRATLISAKAAPVLR